MNYLVGFGHCIPDEVVSNSQLEQRLGLEPGWLLRRTGFSARRYCHAEQAASDLAYVAAKQAIDQAGTAVADIGLVLLATSTPDHPLPGTAPYLSAKLGIAAPALDIMAACTGFLHGLALADSWATATQTQVLLVAANVLSRRVNPNDRQTVGLFGDAAGAVVVSPSLKSQAAHPMLIGSVKGSNQGQHWKQLYIPAGGSRLPLDAENVESDLRYMQMESGRQVFKLAVEGMQSLCEQILEESQLESSAIRWLIPHQASQRIVVELGKRLNIHPRKIAWWLAEFGNSSAATIPVSLSLGAEQDCFQERDRLLLAAAGSGMSSGAALLDVVPSTNSF